MYNDVWGCAEILPKEHLIELLSIVPVSTLYTFFNGAEHTSW